MKKITLLAFLLAGALCASAVTPISKTVKTSPKSRTEIAATRTNGLVPQAIDVQHMRGAKAITEATTWDFEDAEQFAQFTLVDNDGDGFNWAYYNNAGLETGRMDCHSGDGMISSKSYDNDGAGALTPDNWLISPEVTLGGALSFWACGQDASYAAEVFAVYVCVGDPSDVANFVKVGADNTATGDYVEYEFDLSEYEGQNGYFAIRHYNVTDMFMLDIDDITFDPNGVAFNDPGVPTDVAVEPAATSADVTWTPGADNASANLRYREWTDPALMTQLWDFAIADLDAQIEGWSAYDADGDGYGWGLVYTDNTQTDACFNSASYYNGAALTPDNWLFTPAVGLGGTLKFKTWNYMSSYPDKIMVYLCTNPDWESVDEFVAISDFIQPGSTAEEISIDLSAYEGMGVIAFRHYDCTDEYKIYLDDIEVIPANPVEPAEWTVVEDVESPYTIDGLTPETKYEVQVQGVNRPETRAEEEKVSAWTESVEFTTLAEGQEEPVYYVVGFNDWGNPIEIGEEGATVTVSAQDFENSEDTAQEFKVITYDADGATIWFGGADDNGVGYFEITEELLGENITLDDAGANFRLPEAGTYTITLVEPERAALEGLKMVVTKESTTAIESIKSDVKGDNYYYNLMGQKVSGNLPAGIYIHNGKKVVIK